MARVEDVMIRDARRHLVPKLKKIVPVDEGDLKRSIDAGRYSGRNRADADNNNFKLVARVILEYLGRRYVIVVGALDRTTAVYGHIQYQTNRAFRRRWNQVMKEYKTGLSDRLLAGILSGG